MDNKSAIEQIRSGNKEAIKAVYQENAKDIYNFAKSITGNHDSSMEVTKKTFVKLFSDIQEGSEPQDFRLAALKIAYNEACKAAMPDNGSKKAEAQTDSASENEAAETSGVVGDGVIDTKEEFEEVIHESDAESDAQSWKDEPDEIEAPAEEKEADREEINEDTADDQENDEVPASDDAVDSEDASEAGVPDKEEVPVESGEETDDVEEDVSESAEESDEAEEDEEQDELGNTQVFNLSMGYKDGELVIDETEENDEEERTSDTEESDDEDYESQPRKPRKKGVTALIVIINIILIVILLWLIYGLLVSFGLVPQIADLGYTWFNETVYPLF